MKAMRCGQKLRMNLWLFVTLKHLMYDHQASFDCIMCVVHGPLMLTLFYFDYWLIATTETNTNMFKIQEAKSYSQSWFSQKISTYFKSSYPVTCKI